jgi:hypothetical protein
MPEYTADETGSVNAKERMLTELLSAVRARRRRRAAARVAGGVLAVVVAGLVARGYSGPATGPVRNVAMEHGGGEAAVMRVEVVGNSGDILSRTLAKPTGMVEVMDDASLMITLMPRCGNVGLARMGDEVRVFGDCPELAPPTAAQ